MITLDKRNKLLNEYFPNLANEIKEKLNLYYELI